MKRRHITSPRRRPSPSKSATENRIRATLGELRDSKGAELFEFLKQLGASKTDQEAVRQVIADLKTAVKEAAKGKAKASAEARLDAAKKRAWEKESSYRVLCQCFVQELVELFKAKDGDTLRGLAAIVEAPEAAPELAQAFSIAEYLGKIVEAGLQPPSVKRADIVASIRSTTGCDERTAERAIATAGIGKLMRWKAGRPRRQ